MYGVTHANVGIGKSVGSGQRTAGRPSICNARLAFGAVTLLALLALAEAPARQYATAVPWSKEESARADPVFCIESGFISRAK